MHKDNKNLIIGLLLITLEIALVSHGYSAYSYVGSYGTANMNGNQFVVVDKGCQVWVCSYDQNSIRVYHPNGNEAPFSPITTGKNSSGTVIKMYQPSGIAIDTAGIIYVSCDNGSTKNIFKYQSWDSTMINGFEPSFRPGDIDIDTSNNVYIVEKVSTTARVQFYVMNTAGTVLPGAPISVSASSTGTYVNRGIGINKNGTEVYLAGGTENKIWKFTGSVSRGTASFSPAADLVTGVSGASACEVNRQNQVYVSVTNDSAVRVYSNTGTLIQTLSGSGLVNPRGVGFYPGGDVIFIAQFASSMALQKWQVTPSVYIPVLGYHNVTTAWAPAHSLMISPDNLHDQITFLENHGYTVVSLATIYSYVVDGTPIPAKPVAFTFDDNYEGESTFGGMLLSAHGMPGVIFAHTNGIGGVYAQWSNASWSRLSTNEYNGIKTESHAITHPNMTSQTQSQAFSELTGSRAVILQKSPLHECDFFAYPYGADSYSSFPSASLPTLSARAGYAASFSYAGGFVSRISPIHNMPRVTMSGLDTLEDFKSRIGYTGGRIPQDPYIVDNDGNSNGTFATTGTWYTASTVANAVCGCYGEFYTYTGQGTGTKTATFTPGLDAAGSYKVYAWWNEDPKNASNTPYIINHASGSTTVRVNQKASGFSWNYLGTFSFLSGSTNTIVVRDDANGIINADAVKLEAVLTPIRDFMLY